MEDYSELQERTGWHHRTFEPSINARGIDRKNFGGFGFGGICIKFGSIFLQFRFLTLKNLFWGVTHNPLDTLIIDAKNQRL